MLTEEQVDKRERAHEKQGPTPQAPAQFEKHDQSGQSWPGISVRNVVERQFHLGLDVME